MHLGFFIDVTDVSFLVIGGGKVATRKTKKLLAAGARVTAIAPVFQADFPLQAQCILAEVTPDNFISFLQAHTPRIVVLATHDHDLQPKLVQLCKEMGIFVNDSQDGFSEVAFANTTAVNDSIISYFSHGNMEATRTLKSQVGDFVNSIKQKK